MAVNIKNTKYFYPPRPGNGAGTFSDNIVGLQTVEGGGLTQGNFEFTTGVTEKVNRVFNVGAFSEPMSLDMMGIDSLEESRRIMATQFRVYPNYDISQVLNFSMYGSLSKRFSVSITRIINYFPASLDVMFNNDDYTTGNTAYDIVYDSQNDETYFKVNVDRINNPLDIDYSISAATNLSIREIEASPYRNLYNTYLDYCVSINDNIFEVLSFTPSETLSSGYIQFYVSGAPFGTTATTLNNDFQIRPNDYIVDKVFQESFDEVEKFLVNRLVRPEYTAVFQVPQQNEFGQTYTEYKQVTWPKQGPWNLDIRSFLFDRYLEEIQAIAVNLDSFKTNLISRFLITDSLKEFDTLGQKVEKIFQIYGRSFDQIKQFIDGLAYMNSVNYNPSNDIPSELLVNLARTLGWSSNFSPITNDDFLSSVFGNTSTPTYPGYARALTPTELNYAYYRNLILNASYLFKSKGTRRSIEFLLRLIGAPDSLIEYNEYIYLADQRINLDQFETQWASISGGTYVNNIPSYLPGETYKIKGQLYTAFTSTATYQDVSIRLEDYPMDAQGYPNAPANTETFFFQIGSGWYETTPQHRSPDQVQLTGNVFTGQNYNIQTQLTPFTYGQTYLNRYRDFPYMNEGFKLQKVVDNNKSWLSDDDRIRVSTQGDYNAYYYVDNEKLVLNVKNVDIFLNPAQGILYDVWEQSRQYDYPIPETGLTVNYSSPVSQFSTFSLLSEPIDYSIPSKVDYTYINPEPKKKTFFEFSQTFWENMINTRNRLYITDGKTGGYPTLQSIFWKYIESEQTVGLPNNKYTYQKLIDYVNGIGPYWTKLVEQMVPATTIWNGGVRLENSILNKQKFVYRRQRGCQFIPVPVDPCYIISNIFDYTCNSEYAEFNIYPWFNGDVTVSNFSSILVNRVNNMLAQSGLTLNQCYENSVLSDWYVDLTINEEQIIKESFYTGYGLSDVPTNTQWRNALINYLPQLYNYGYTYYLNGNTLTITDLACLTQNVVDTVSLNVGINININCTQ
jgi:hypothetical protein